MENKTIGIYAIFRKSDDKCMYIGQSKECERRIHGHLNGSANTPIENPNDYYTDIIEKHGFDSSVFRLEREAFWINVFEPEWNINRNRTISENQKQTISKANLGDNNPQKRPEVRQKNRETHLGENNPMYRKPKSEETRQKMSESHLGKPSPNKGKHWKLVDGKRVWY